MEWISPNQEIEKIEGETLSAKIIVDEDNNYIITKVSGNFPNSISLIEKEDGYYLEGNFDLVEKTTEYYFTLQASNEEKSLQQWFSIKVDSKITEWGLNEDVPTEVFEKTYFSYQFELKNPEGNERFKKIYGELPNGIFISDTDNCVTLMYAKAYVDNPEMKISIDDLHTIYNKAKDLQN